MVMFADPYKKCVECGRWVNGAVEGIGPLVLVPCGHRSDYRDVCPSWSPIDGCTCALTVHPQRKRPYGDDRVYRLDRPNDG